MARVLAISSQVAHGYVGLSATVPALHKLGHEVLALPTIILSSHPGYPHFAGQHTSIPLLERMFDSFDANGWLNDVAAVLIGYLPTRDHVLFASEALHRVAARTTSTLNVCDPIFGDDPEGNYADIEIAAAIRDALLPICDIATPNRYELSWLAGRPVNNFQDATIAARSLSVPGVLATSIPATPDRIGTLLITDQMAASCTVPRLPHVPKGTGDLLTALFLGHRLNDRTNTEALAKAVAGVKATLTQSENRDELALPTTQNLWTTVKPVAVRTD